MKTNAVWPLVLELVEVLVVVVERIGLQSSRLMNLGGGDFRRGTNWEPLKKDEEWRRRVGHNALSIHAGVETGIVE